MMKNNNMKNADFHNDLWIWGIVTVAVVGGAIVCVALAKKKYNRI